MDSSHELAQEHLRKLLVGLLGPRLKGVTGFGVRWDRELNQPTLGVFLDRPDALALVRTKLPTTIGDLPVRVTARGPAHAAAAGTTLSTQ
jgi:hypothetical protein